jgi:uncharacterized membrane protein
MNKSRVEAFSDGVFAIAITLLVLTIAQPSTHQYGNLGHFFLNQWPSLAAYIVSFAIIGIMWINHHSVFRHLEYVDRTLLYLNLLLLATIAFLPYPTGVLGQALAKGEGTRTAAVVYGVVMTLNACAWSVLWLYASRHRRLLRTDFPEGERATATVLFTLGVLVYTLSVGVAFLSAYAFLALQGALAIYYALDPISRRTARVGLPHQEGPKPAGGGGPERP